MLLAILAIKWETPTGINTKLILELGKDNGTIELLPITTHPKDIVKPVLPKVTIVDKIVVFDNNIEPYYSSDILKNPVMLTFHQLYGFRIKKSMNPMLVLRRCQNSIKAMQAIFVTPLSFLTSVTHKMLLTMG
ncbi:MAG TPA: hypothetical protein ENN49_10845 [Bacteroidales bacterium]|nr:hypothetical protein [Bacteroidales bacterium]